MRTGRAKNARRSRRRSPEATSPDHTSNAFPEITPTQLFLCNVRDGTSADKSSFVIAHRQLIHVCQRAHQNASIIVIVDAWHLHNECGMSTVLPLPRAKVPRGNARGASLVFVFRTHRDGRHLTFARKAWSLRFRCCPALRGALCGARGLCSLSPLRDQGHVVALLEYRIGAPASSISAHASDLHGDVVRQLAFVHEPHEALASRRTFNNSFAGLGVKRIPLHDFGAQTRRIHER